MSVREELERLRLENGGTILPEKVVDAARSESSPLHSSFDWNDGEAAEKWRLHQARNLIRVYVQVVPNEESGKETRVYVSLSTDRAQGGGYRAIGDVMSDEAMRAVLLRDAYDDMRRFRQKYGTLKELAGVFEAMERSQVPV